jgi:hypothetical protein
MMRTPKIKHVRAENDYTLLVTFENGQKKKYDVKPLFDKDMFILLKNPAFFKNVQIEPGGYAISWNKDIDISEHELWKNGIPAECAECEKTEHSR